MGSKRFAANIQRFVEKTKIKADLLLRKLALDAYRGVVMVSPVDTGRFRLNWQVGINRTPMTRYEPQEGYKPPPLGAPPTAFESGNAKGTEVEVFKAKFGDTIIIANNVVYAYPLETGTSKQAPNGVLKVVFAQISRSLEEAVRAVENA